MGNPTMSDTVDTTESTDAKSGVTAVVGSAPNGLAQLSLTIDSRSGGAVIVDGAGNIHRLQILAPMHGANPAAQDVYYAVTKPGDPYTTMNFQPLGIANKVFKRKIYSVDSAAIQTVNGQTTIVFLIEISLENPAGEQSKLLCYLQGANVVPNH